MASIKRGDGRLAVGAGDRDQARRVGAGSQARGGEVDLRPHRHAGLVRGDERGVVGADAGARHDEVGGAALGGGLGGVGTLEHARAVGFGARDARRVRLAGAGGVVEHGDVVAGGAGVRHHRRARRREADHEDAHQSSTPGMRMKSA